MNYFKIGILAFMFVFSATLTSAQSEEIPTLYGDKGGPESVSEEELIPVPELINEEVPELAPELINEEKVEVVPMEEEKSESNMWYWVIVTLVILGGAWWYLKSRKSNVDVN